MAGKCTLSGSALQNTRFHRFCTVKGWVARTGKLRHAASASGVVLLGMIVLLLASINGPASALEPVSVSRDDTALDITDEIDFYSEDSDNLKISTVPGADGIVRRIEVRSKETAEYSNWVVFALANNTNEQLDRLIVAPHYRMSGSGLFWPKLDSERITAITPSEGFALERIRDSEADVFLITLDPGAVITLIGEQKSPYLPKLFLWDPDTYKDTINSYTLYRGIVLGISGLLAVFLTILFVVKGSAIFPATAALAWGVLAYVCVDFGFWTKVIGFTGPHQEFWRAGAEVFLAVSLIIFIYTYLSLNRWHTHFSTIAIAWVMGLVILLGVAFALPSMAAGIARLSFSLSVAIAAILIVFMSFRHFDRAIMLIPTWALICAWTIAASMTAMGKISNDIVQPALIGGMVLVVMLLGFTVMQHAFAGGAITQGLVSDVERQALALTGSGDIVWEWEVLRDYFFTGREAAAILNLNPKQLSGNPKSWMQLLHPNDRDRFEVTLDAIIEHKRGQISQNFRLRSADGHYYWFHLRARPMLGSDGTVIRCIGTLSEVTTRKNSEDRLLVDSVHDHLTGLENSQMFVSRLSTIMALAQRDKNIRPSVVHVNIDHFLEINSKYGVPAGDTILLTVARRMMRLLKGEDAMARLGGDQFCILLNSESEPSRIASFAENLRRILRAPVQYADDEIVLSASIGIATWSATKSDATQMMRDAELAMFHAKRFGGDRIEPYRPAFNSSRDTTTILLEDLKKALDNREIEAVYQPIVSLSDMRIAGFEALVRWKHPTLGFVPPAEFIAIAERSGLVNKISLQMMESAASNFAAINKGRGDDKVFVSVNLSSRELLHHDIVNDIEGVLRNSGLPAEYLHLEITENLVMDNPEHSAQVLQRIKSLGVGLSLDDFGTGYSSLSYLTRYPFDSVKIDRSFLQSKPFRERAIMLRSIIAMIQGLNQQAIAEGVENENDVTELLQLQCAMAQGYHFGEPMAIEEIPSVLAPIAKKQG